MDTQEYLGQIWELVWLYVPKVIAAAILLVGGLWVIRRISAVFRHFLQKRKIDQSLRSFFVSTADVGMKVLLLLIVANNIGLKTTSFLALFSALALSVGLALQGSLGNFASGVMVLLFKPFRVGDWLEVDGRRGYVSEIQIFNTVITAADGRRVIIPNTRMTQGIIENISEKGKIRVEATVQVSNKVDFSELQQAAGVAVQNCPHLTPGEPVFVEPLAFPGEGVRAQVGCWTTGQNYWSTFYRLRRELKKALDAAGIVGTVE